MSDRAVPDADLEEFQKDLLVRFRYAPVLNDVPLKEPLEEFDGSSRFRIQIYNLSN